MLSLATNGTSPSATTFGTLNGSESVTYVAISVNNTVVLGAVPIAEFSASSEVGDLATVFEFDATACYDLEDPLEMLEVRWDFDGDGVWDTDWTTEKVAYHQYTTPGNYTVWLEVRDTQGLTNFTEMSIEVWEIIPEFSTVIVPILSLLFLVAVVARSRLRRDMRRKPG